MSPMSFPLAFSPSVHSPFSLSLSPQRNPVSPLGLELFEGDPELYCSLPPLSSLPYSLPPPPSTLRSHPSAPHGAWIPLNREQPCFKSRPGLSAPAAGLAGCPTAPQRDRKVGGLGREERGAGEVGGKRCVWSRWHLRYKRDAAPPSKRFSKLSTPLSYQSCLPFPHSLHITVYFPFSFHPLTPSLFPSHFPSLPSIPRASSQTRPTGFFGTPRTHKHTLGCQHTLRHIPLDFKRGSFTQWLTVGQEKTENDKQTDRGGGKKEKEADKGRGYTGEMCIPLACLARECRRRVAGCSVYYPQAIWVGKLLGRGGIHLCVCPCECACVSG